MSGTVDENWRCLTCSWEGRSLTCPEHGGSAMVPCEVADTLKETSPTVGEVEKPAKPNGKAKKPAKNTDEGKRKGNTLLRKISGEATVGDEQAYSEGEFARSWALAHGLDEFLFVDGIGWHHYDAGRWHEGTAKTRRSMSTLIKDAVQQTKIAPRFDCFNSVEGALKMARVEPDERRTVELDSFDKNSMAIGLPGGQLFDIAKGTARPAKPGDRIRKALAIAPDHEPSQAWADFVYQSLNHYDAGQRDNVASWLQEFCGAMLSGDCRDQKCLFIWGEPGTGKTVFAETLRHVMGTYSAVLAGERIAGREDGHRQWVVGLQGRRLVLVNELPERGRWHTADLNAMIEGSALEGNSMRQNSVVFDSQASVLITGNHRARASAASGIWRRLVQIEFRNKPEVPDPKLLDKLKAEASGVLAWMVEGAARWHERGQMADVPKPITQAVESYRRDADPFAEFLSERTVKTPARSSASMICMTTSKDGGCAKSTMMKRLFPKNADSEQS